MGRYKGTLVVQHKLPEACMFMFNAQFLADEKSAANYFEHWALFATSTHDIPICWVDFSFYFLKMSSSANENRFLT